MSKRVIVALDQLKGTLFDAQRMINDNVPEKQIATYIQKRVNVLFHPSAGKTVCWSTSKVLKQFKSVDNVLLLPVKIDNVEVDTSKLSIIEEEAEDILEEYVTE